MQQKFESHGCMYDVEYFHNGNTDIIRFFERKNEQYKTSLADLVIAVPSYGFLQMQYIDDDIVLSGILNKKYFQEEMVEDILNFLEDNFPKYKNTYQVYHIEFVSVSDSVEYNGEY